MVILLMGVTGVGKSTVGHALAQQLRWQFADADDFHPSANVAKMRAGIPLDDADRAPWLSTLHDKIVGWLASNESVVLACSALKESYRRQLVVGSEVKLVFLNAKPDVIAERLRLRHGHYMNPALLQSQFDTLEAPHDAVTVDADQSVDGAIAAIRAGLGL